MLSSALKPRGAMFASSLIGAARLELWEALPHDHGRFFDAVGDVIRFFIPSFTLQERDAEADGCSNASVGFGPHGLMSVPGSTDSVKHADGSHRALISIVLFVTGGGWHPIRAANGCCWALTGGEGSLCRTP